MSLAPGSRDFPVCSISRNTWSVPGSMALTSWPRPSTTCTSGRQIHSKSSVITLQCNNTTSVSFMYSWTLPEEGVLWQGLIMVVSGLIALCILCFQTARHSDMEHSEECPSYIVQNRARTGCNLSHDLLEEFTDFNICVNSSSPGVVVRPAFFSLQVQNQGITIIYLHTTFVPPCWGLL